LILALMLARARSRIANKLRNTAVLARDAEQRRSADATIQGYALRERMYIAAVETASYPIITTAPDGIITAWNPAAERLYNYSAEEAIGRNINIIMPDDSYNGLVAKAVDDDEAIETLQTTCVKRDGRPVDVVISLRPVRSVSGDVVAFATITRDITAQKSAEEKFRLAVESCPSGMMMIDETGSIVMVNTEIERMFGYSHNQLIGQSVEVLVPERMRGQHLGHRTAFADKPEVRRIGAGREFFGRRRDGTEFPVEVGLNPIKTREGVMILSVIVDITERKQAEEMFRLAVEACPCGMMVVDTAGKMVMVNSEIEHLFGYRRDELVGKSVEILVPERLRKNDVDHRNAFGGALLVRRVGENRDLYGLRKDGTEFPVEVGLNPIHVGQTALVLSVVVDISERKRMDRLKDEFVATVSHELRTPLTSIAGSLGLLVGGAAGRLPEPAMRLTAIAQNNSERLVRLINDILDIEKLESGQSVFNFKRVELRSTIEQAIEAMRAFADSHNVTVKLDESAVGDCVRADPDRLAQVVTNLLSNAIKFSPPNGVVEVTIETKGSSLRFKVRDHGAGIPHEFKPRIFEKFAQADTTDARQLGGTGLGLSIVKEIVTRLGGTVGFEDAPGGGTIFFVQLPNWSSVSRRRTDADEMPAKQKPMEAA
ncbi:MAG: PAS domain S-box protein, partial [Xanthobacteraceae bacterium]